MLQLEGAACALFNIWLELIPVLGLRRSSCEAYVHHTVNKASSDSASQRGLVFIIFYPPQASARVLKCDRQVRPGEAGLNINAAVITAQRSKSPRAKGQSCLVAPG